MINNPKEDIKYENTQISRAIWAALQTQTSSTAKNFITKMAKEGPAEALAAGADVGEFAVGVSICTAWGQLCGLPRGPRPEAAVSEPDGAFSFQSQDFSFCCWRNLSKKINSATCPLLLLNLLGFNMYVLSTGHLF